MHQGQARRRLPLPRGGTAKTMKPDGRNLQFLPSVYPDTDERGVTATMAWFCRVFVGFAILSVLALPVRLIAPAAADPAADFCSGKTVRVLIGFSPGGGYDIYARTLGRFMSRHIPGNPTLVPQNMPGAGSLKAVNYLGLNLDIDPVTGSEVEELIREVYASSPEAVQLATTSMKGLKE